MWRFGGGRVARPHEDRVARGRHTDLFGGLFSTQTATYGQSGYYHSLHDADLAVQSVTVDGDTATIVLTGTLLPIGSCADAQMQAQILLTVFQYPSVNSALITVDGKNVKKLFDVSGTVGDDQAYERSQNW